MGGNPKNPSGKKSSPKCFAAMYNRDTGKKYAAISGVFDADMYIYPGVTTKKQKNKSLRRKNEYKNLVLLLKSILGKSYEVIDSDDDVEYYYKKNGKPKKVTAKRYISYPYPIDKRPGNRMFSCCERKLSTKLVYGCEHDFYVKYAPCNKYFLGTLRKEIEEKMHDFGNMPIVSMSLVNKLCEKELLDY